MNQSSKQYKPTSVVVPDLFTQVDLSAKFQFVRANLSGEMSDQAERALNYLENATRTMSESLEYFRNHTDPTISVDLKVAYAKSMITAAQLQKENEKLKKENFELRKWLFDNPENNRKTTG